MLYKNIINPLPAIGRLYSIYELQDKPHLPQAKVYKGLCWGAG